MAFPPEEFSEYILPNCNRADFICNYLKKRNVDTVDLTLDGKRHIYVKFPSEHYNSQFKIKTVISHYDRAPNSPGANDNSAANFCLMDWAVRLMNFYDGDSRAAGWSNSAGGGASPSGGFHNVRLLFTDGEELGSNGVSDQGSFALATIFRRLGMTRDDVYVFDCVGRGNIPVLGKNDRLANAPLNFQKHLADLEDRTKRIFSAACKGRWLSLPLPYSDNAGFVACGIPAVAITFLPEREADNYMKSLLKEKHLEAFVLNREAAGCFDESRESEIERKRLETLLPETWQLFHTKYDSLSSLTAESFDLMEKILDTLALEKTLV